MGSITRFNAYVQAARLDSDRQRFLSIAATMMIFIVMVFAITACGSSGSGTVPATATVAAPGAPANFGVAATSTGTLSATLTWSPPAIGGVPASYQIYRSTTAGSAYQPANLVTSVAMVAGQMTYTYVDNAGLTPVNTYWVVSAKNAGGETATAEVMYKPAGAPIGGFGNNFSAALVFGVC